jgi:hypothetical protein
MRWVCLLVLAGCWQRTLRSSETPSVPALECVDCKQPVAVGMPIRVATSWLGTCTEEGIRWSLESHHDDVEWRRSEYSDTETCNRKAYKISVTCSTKCIVQSTRPPEGDSHLKVLSVFPTKAGPFRFEITMRATDAPPTSEPAAVIASDIVVREPDFVGVAMQRKYEEPSPRVAFAGFEYDLIPTTRHRLRIPSRGDKYTPRASTGAAFDRLDRRCYTRAPGSATWHDCSAGIRPDDDVRIDVTPTRGGYPLPDDVQLTVEDEGWHCYRTSLILNVQTCTHYAIPAGTHALTWTLGSATETDQLAVNASADAPGPPASVAGSGPQSDAVAVSFDSREAFDTRGIRGYALLGLETEIIRWNETTYPVLSVLLEAPVRPRAGALRLGIGGSGSDEDRKDKLLRVILGWRYPVGCIAYKLCFNVAADVGYRFADTMGGAFVLPHANIELRGRSFMARLGAGPALLLGSQREVGFVVKITTGLGGSY